MLVHLTGQWHSAKPSCLRMGTTNIPNRTLGLDVKECSLSIKCALSVRSLPEANLSGFANGLMKDLEKFNVKPEDFSLEESDSLFGYTLKAALFNSLATIDLSPSTIEVRFKGLTGTYDFNIAALVFGAAMTNVSDRGDAKCYVTWMGHATFNEPDISDDFWRNLAPPNWSFGGTTAICTGAEATNLELEFAKISLEKSYSYNNGAFLTLEMAGFSSKESSDGDSLWAKIAEAFRDFALTPSLKKPD